MLDLMLRQEFQGRSMPDTAIALHRQGAQGAIDRPPEDFLKITYPTTDVVRSLKCVRQGRDGGPVVLKGGFPKVCHEGLSLLEVASPWIEIKGRK